MISGKGQLAGSKKTCRQGQHFIGIFKLQVHRPPSVLLFEVRVNSIFFLRRIFLTPCITGFLILYFVVWSWTKASHAL